MKRIRQTVLVVLALLLSSCSRPMAQPTPEESQAPSPSSAPSARVSKADSNDGTEGLEIATMGGGCFWCTEAVFSELKGVKKVVSGYTGGTVEKPTYRQVCGGQTGHAEVIQVFFDPKQIAYKDILTVFFTTHDPTTLNRQGADTGTQYRSVIFYHGEQQRQIAEQVKQEMQAQFSAPIVTEISPSTKFWVAEDYHQNYFELNPTEGYCRVVIAPKMAKFRKQYTDKLKSH